MFYHRDKIKKIKPSLGDYWLNITYTSTLFFILDITIYSKIILLQVKMVDDDNDDCCSLTFGDKFWEWDRSKQLDKLSKEQHMKRKGRQLAHSYS